MWTEICLRECRIGLGNVIALLYDTVQNYSLNKYESTVDEELAERCCIGAGQTLCFHSPGGSTLLHVMMLAAFFCQLMHIYLNIPATFHQCLIPVWNSGTLGIFWRRSPQEEEDNKMSIAIWDQFLI